MKKIPEGAFGKAAGNTPPEIGVDIDKRKLFMVGKNGKPWAFKELDDIAKSADDGRDPLGVDWARNVSTALTDRIAQDPAFAKRFFPADTVAVHVDAFSSSVSAYTQTDLAQTLSAVSDKMGNWKSTPGKKLSPPRRPPGPGAN